MEENIIIEKEYTIPYELFCKAYNSHLKKNVYPKSYIFIGIFLIIAVIYIIAAIKDPSNMLSYVLIFLCIGFAFREWYNPRKIRRNIVDTVKALGEPLYKIEVFEKWVDISTLSDEIVENSAEEQNISDADDSESTVEAEELPEKTRIPINSELSVHEYDEFFLLYAGKTMFYIVPKKDFNEYENEAMREINLRASSI